LLYRLTKNKPKRRARVKIGKFPFVGNSKATILGITAASSKFVSDEKIRRSFGLHIIGPLAHGNSAEAAAF